MSEETRVPVTSKLGGCRDLETLRGTEVKKGARKNEEGKGKKKREIFYCFLRTAVALSLIQPPCRRCRAALKIRGMRETRV